jgi:hypothetical protein
MSQQGKQGRQNWRGRRDTLAAEIADQITAVSTDVAAHRERRRLTHRPLPIHPFSLLGNLAGAGR